MLTGALDNFTQSQKYVIACLHGQAKKPNIEDHQQTKDCEWVSEC